MKIRDHVNIDELVFDVTFAVMLFLFGFLVSSGSGRLVEAVNPAAMVVLMALMGLFAPWYVAEIYCRYRDHAADHPGYRPLKVFALVSGILISFITCFVLPTYMGYVRRDDLFYSGYAAVNIFTGPLALALGWNFGMKYRENRQTGKGISDGIFGFLVPVLGLVGPFAFVFLLLAAGMKKDPLYALGGVLLLGSFFVFARSKNRFDRLFSGEIMRLYVFPFLISAMLMFSEEVIQDTFPARAGKNAGDFFLSLAINGLLPLRIMLLLCPPVKLINFLVSAAALFLLVFRYFS